LPGKDRRRQAANKRRKELNLKPNIHPKYQEATVTCACGNSWTTRSTKAQLRTDVCSACHPFFTGEQRIVDTAGQVERFMRRMQRSQERPAAPAPQPVQAAAKPAKPAKAPKPAREAARPATLEALLETPAGSES
jgi:large subunit ribosomal protein L31